MLYEVITDTIGVNALNQSQTIPLMLAYTFGLDVLYQPLQVSLSGLLQLTPSSDDRERLDTFILTLSYAYGS